MIIRLTGGAYCVERALKSHHKTLSAKLVRASGTARRDSGLSQEDKVPRRKESADADLAQLLFELALALLPRGVTPSSFSKIARVAFIRAAAGHARLRNGKVNHSKIAALTGLPRKEIRRALNHPSTRLEQDATTRMPSERVVRGWLTDPRFLARPGHPKFLAITGKTLSFERLVKEYGGDISPRAVLEELVRSRTARRVGDRLELQAARLPYPRGGLGSLARVIPTLVDGLRIGASQPASKIDSMLYRLNLQAATEAELALIRQRCTSAVQSLLRGLKESLEQEFISAARKRSSTHALAVTVLLADTGLSGPSGDIGRRN